MRAGKLRALAVTGFAATIPQSALNNLISLPGVRAVTGDHASGGSHEAMNSPVIFSIFTSPSAVSAVGVRSTPSPERSKIAPLASSSRGGATLPATMRSGRWKK